MNAPDVIDAEHTLVSTVPAIPSPTAIAPASADHLAMRLAEFERFKSLMLTEKDYHLIEGKRRVKAESAMRLAVAPQISFAIVSRNEHGETGVRRNVVEDLVYPMKSIQKRTSVWEDKPGGGRQKTWKTIPAEVPDYTADPRVVKSILYTVTMRATDCFGRVMEHDASFSPTELEYTASDNTYRARCETRARTTLALKLIGGVDAEIAEEVHANIRAAQAEIAVRQGRIPTTAQIALRAFRAGLCRPMREDKGESFCAWVREACGLSGAGSGWQPSTEEKLHMVSVLEQVEVELAGGGA